MPDIFSEVSMWATALLVGRLQTPAAGGIIPIGTALRALTFVIPEPAADPEPPRPHDEGDGTGDRGRGDGDAAPLREQTQRSPTLLLWPQGALMETCS